MAKNPLLKQKFSEGYNEGFEKGMKEGISRSTAFFIEKFADLEKSSGIGPKTIEKIKAHLGQQYFK